MTAESLIAFALAFCVSAALPGPSVTALVARSMTLGFRTGFGMGLGCVFGDLFWACCALFGLALLAEFAAPALMVLKYAGAAYIIWMGWKLLTAPAAMLADDETAPRESLARAILSGMAITLGNPKTMAFYMAIMPGFFDFTTLGLGDKFMILGVIPPILLTMMTLYAALADRARRALRDTRVVTRINRGAGGVMVGAGVVIAAA